MSDSDGRELLHYDTNGLPVYRMDRLTYETAVKWKACQACRIDGRKIKDLIRHASKVGLRRKGQVGWRRVMLCRACVARARIRGYEVWEPVAPRLTVLPPPPD